MGTDIHGVFQKKVGNKWEDIPSLYEQDRHYLLFAWLGNVRNGFGFAEIIPLSDNRSLPQYFEIDGYGNHPITSLDIMDSRRREYHEDDEPLEIWMGDHSYSWLSADEIINGEKPRIMRTGIISIEQLKIWDGISEPDSYSGGVSGPGIVVSNWKEVTEKTTHVQIEWFENTADTLAYFVDEVKRLKNKYGYVRFVFGFDS